MVQQRWKRKSGYVTPRATISSKEICLYDLSINQFYDNWEDWRDGFRDWFRDFKTIKKVNQTKGMSLVSDFFEKRKRMNEKQEKLLLRRKSMKNIK